MANIEKTCVIRRAQYTKTDGTERHAYSVGSEKWICWDCRHKFSFSEALHPISIGVDYSDEVLAAIVSCVMCGKDISP